MVTDCPYHQEYPPKEKFLHYYNNNWIIKTVVDKLIKFEKVPIVTPSGELLIKELDIEIRKGMNCIILGPNGCGKTSLFRVLGELWPMLSGVLRRPSVDHLF